MLVDASALQDQRVRGDAAREIRGGLPRPAHDRADRRRRAGAPACGRDALGRRLRRSRERVGRAALRERAALTQFDEPINIQYTSGTTGFPKGATLSHHNILNNGFFIGEGCRYTERDRVCIPVPFYHCFGMVLGNLACVTHGATMVIPAPAFDRGADARGRRKRERCTSLYGVPTMFIAELALPNFADLRSLDAAHRHHGRLAVPGRGDEARADRDAHAARSRSATA